MNLHFLQHIDRKTRSLLLAVCSAAFFFLAKSLWDFPKADLEVVSLMLTIASILFGFLSGFFISELWGRYSEIRTLQNERSADFINLIATAEHFSEQEEFHSSFLQHIEEFAITDETVDWSETRWEIPILKSIRKTFDSLVLQNSKDELYFERLLVLQHNIMRITVKEDVLGRERLFPSEWMMLGVLSFIIAVSVLLIDTTHLFYQLIIFSIPPVIILLLTIIHDLDTLMWSKELVSLEPNARIFDAIGVKRFYLSSKEGHISKHVTDYRTEHDLDEHLHDVYNAVLRKRELGYG